LCYEDSGAVNFGSRHHGIFSGSPSAQIANDWEDLLQRRFLKLRVTHNQVVLHTDVEQALYINVSKEELLAARVSPDVSVRVEQGGFIANLGVYHELHCLVSTPLDSGIFPSENYSRTRYEIFCGVINTKGFVRKT
jgi:hypothetical protein